MLNEFGIDEPKTKKTKDLLVNLDVQEKKVLVLTGDLTICTFNAVIFGISSFIGFFVWLRLIFVSLNLDTHKDWCINWRRENLPNEVELA